MYLLKESIPNYHSPNFKISLPTVFPDSSNVGQGASEASSLTIPLSGVTRRLSEKVR
jgi:hypothetical protein